MGSARSGRGVELTFVSIADVDSPVPGRCRGTCSAAPVNAGVAVLKEFRVRKKMGARSSP
jgi:hypothetical protein